MVLVSNIAIVIGIVSVIWWAVATIVYMREKRKFRRHEAEMDRKWDAHWKSMDDKIKEMDYAYAERQRRRKEALNEE